MRAQITGLGFFVPPTIQTAEELGPLIGRSARWIHQRTHVAQRRIASIDVSEMGAEAARAALGDGEPPDLILNASGIGPQTLPDGAVFLQRALGLEGVACHSVHATCLSFLVALQTAACFVSQGLYKRVLIVSSERGSLGRNFSEPESAALLGDGAGAVVLEPAPEGSSSAILTSSVQTWPAGAHLTEVRGGGTRHHPNDPETTPADNLFTMDGPRVYRMARARVSETMDRLLQDCDLEPASLRCVIPHQASGMAVEAYVRFGGFHRDQVVNYIREYGNCVAASLPICLARAHAEGRFERGDHLMLIGTGAGLTVGGMILRF